MIELHADLWDTAFERGGSVVVTTNQVVNKNGLAVMGKGCAKECADRYPAVPALLAALYHAYSPGIPIYLGSITEREHYSPGHWGPAGAIQLWSLPVKLHWKDKAAIELIRHSIEFLTKRCDLAYPVVLPRPGCGAGGLSWDEVRPVIAPALDDRFIVVGY
jgi:hypothetical protein